jgi:pyruvate,water dikinase
MYTKLFNELNKEDFLSAGGKGASLGEMIQNGVPVPEGFVILASSFEDFLKETDLNVEIDAVLHTVNQKEIHTVENASEKIKSLILNAKIPNSMQVDIISGFNKLGEKYVAVRSSATAEDGKDHAWAGQLESYLNVKEEDLIEKVKHCWASLFTPRAIFYRFEKGLDSTKISVAVVVQKMVESEISGIAFSVHPVTQDRDQIIIEAGFGLGEAIVSGQITPDSYVVSKEQRKILDINVSTQTKGLYCSDNGGSEWIDIQEPKASSQVLSEEQILQLSDLIVKIENHYNFPCDIEWAFKDNMFYIVQSRPITTLI